MSFIQEIVDRLNRNPFNSLAIIGKPGTGKSTLGFLVAELLSKYFYYTKEPEALDVDNLKLIKQGFAFANGRRLVLFFDDFSFAISGRSQKDRQRLKNLVEIRHILGEKRRYFVILVGHYIRSLAPTLRSAHIKILTSLDATEINLYSTEYMFSENSLIAYLEYLTERPKDHIVLVNYGTTEKIINLTLPRVGVLTRHIKVEEYGPWLLYRFAFDKKKLLNTEKVDIILEDEDENGNNNS